MIKSDSNPQLMSQQMCGEPGQSPPNREEDPQRSNPRGGGGSSPPSSPDCGGADSNGFSTTSKAVGGQQRCRRWRNEKHLAPTCLDMPIFKTIDPNADIMHTIWKFDIEAWLDQYDDVSMMLISTTASRGTQGSGCTH